MRESINMSDLSDDEVEVGMMRLGEFVAMSGLTMADAADAFVRAARLTQ